jgi:glycosyltransferase involved in cell wall biosynthesis
MQSLLNQTITADEIIIVDDGSSDGTAELAETFGEGVRVIRQNNQGPAAARNRGFAESTGEFLHFFDSDDIALRNKHEVQLQALETSGADIAFGPWVKGRIDFSGFTPENQVLQQRGLPRGDLIKALLTSWSIVPHACLFRRSIVDRIGGFPEEIFVAEDQLMFLRCLLAGAKVVHSPGTLELYRTNDAGKLTAGRATAKIRHHRDWARFLVMARKECMDHHIDPSRWSGFRQRVWQAAKDLKALTCDAEMEDLWRQLQAILGKHSDSRFALRSWLARKWGGLQQRLVGRRGSSEFRMGPMTSAQWELARIVLNPDQNQKP